MDMVLCQLEVGYIRWVGVRWVVVGSLPNGVSVQSGRVSIMCGGASLWPVQPWFCLHQRVALSFVKNGFLLP